MTSFDPESRTELWQLFRLAKKALRELQKSTELSERISRKCISWRILEVGCLLRLQGFSDYMAYEAAEYAGEQAEKAIENHAAEHQRNRGGWFWTTALHEAQRLAVKEPEHQSIDSEKSEEVADTYDCLDPEMVVAMKPYLRKALQGLPDKHRTALLRRHLGHQSIRKIARKMKVTTRHVKRLLEEGRQRLRDALIPVWTLQFEI